MDTTNRPKGPKGFQKGHKHSPGRPPGANKRTLYLQFQAEKTERMRLKQRKAIIAKAKREVSALLSVNSVSVPDLETTELGAFALLPMPKEVEIQVMAIVGKALARVKEIDKRIKEKYPKLDTHGRVVEEKFEEDL